MNTPTAATGTAAVLYVCADRDQWRRESGRSEAEDQARDEGHAYAAAHGLDIVATYDDPYGEPDPDRRPGWCAMRARLALGDVRAVITRWPAAVAPDSHHETRFAALRDLQDRGITVAWTWEFLAAEEGARCGA